MWCESLLTGLIDLGVTASPRMTSWERRRERDRMKRDHHHHQEQKQWSRGSERERASRGLQSFLSTVAAPRRRFSPSLYLCLFIFQCRGFSQAATDSYIVAGKVYGCRASIKLAIFWLWNAEKSFTTNLQGLKIPQGSKAYLTTTTSRLSRMPSACQSTQPSFGPNFGNIVVMRKAWQSMSGKKMPTI